MLRRQSVHLAESNVRTHFFFHLTQSDIVLTMRISLGKKNALQSNPEIYAQSFCLANLAQAMIFTYTLNNTIK